METARRLVFIEHAQSPPARYVDEWRTRLRLVVAVQRAKGVFPVPAYTGFSLVGKRFFYPLGFERAGERGIVDRVSGADFGDSYATTALKPAFVGRFFQIDHPFPFFQTPYRFLRAGIRSRLRARSRVYLQKTTFV